jgi:hypothetical protein
MIMRRISCFLAALPLTLILGTTASAGTFFFSTGAPDGRIASASYPEGRGKTEHESADDFILTGRTVLQTASFTGVLFHGGPGEGREVNVELYHLFPQDSNPTRPPQVPTRMNSPADEAFDARSSADGTLRFAVTVLSPNIGVANSVIDGINASPAQRTGGEGPVAGQEVRIDVVFERPFDLPADHYFLVPQVLLEGVGGHFLWLSAPHPQFAGDLQMWVRKAELAPDWLRVGKDIVDGNPSPTFDGSFSLSGQTIP